MSRWLVTGGAGYIGSHVVDELTRAGHDVVVLDDLSTGFGERVTVPIVEASLTDPGATASALSVGPFDGVVHLAANKRVDESVRDPLRYYERNIGGLVNLLRAMEHNGVTRLVYSSSAAVYGTPTAELVDEHAPTIPENAYGESKLAGEWLIRRQAAAADLRFVALRYFNVAGAASELLADRRADNLVPIALQALRDGVAPRIFGDDFPTEDGTGVRDYIHVADLARAHLAVADLLDEPHAAHVFNVGRGHGYSVREVIDVACDVTGRTFEPCVVDRRAGDPARVVADPTRLQQYSAWRPQHELRDMVASAWAAMTTPRDSRD